jgi:hypothetical protein
VRFATLPPNDYSLIDDTKRTTEFRFTSPIDIAAQPQGHHDEHQIDTARNHRDLGRRTVAIPRVRRHAADRRCAGSAA